LTIWRQWPIFGLGEGMLVEETGAVAHNSFIHCFAELGIFGGTVFVSCFLAAGLGLWALRGQLGRSQGTNRLTPELRDLAHVRIFIFASLAAYVGGMLALSRQFVTPTYLVLGLATAAQSMHSANVEKWRIGNRFLGVALLASTAMLLASYVVVRIFVRW
jgi:O-antigen ligase